MRRPSRLSLLLAFCATFGLSNAHAQIAPELAPQQFAQLGAVTLENKTVIDNCAIGYRTLGKLNAARSNAIVFLTWHTGKSEDALSMFGAKGLFDPAPYYVVIVDAIGNGVSCSPSNSATQHGITFPTFTIRDMVATQYRLLTEKLQLQHVHAVMGYSMGGMQTFQWMISHPDFMDLALPMSGTPRMSSYDQLFWRTEELLMISDPEYAKGNYSKNPRLAAMQLVFSMNFTSPAHRIASTKPEDSEKFFEETAAYDPDAADANDWRWQAKAMLTQDVGVEVVAADGKKSRSLALAAAKVKARSHVIVASQDHLVNPQAALDFAQLIKADTTMLEGHCGHLALNCQMSLVRPVIERLLKLAP